MSEGNCPWCEHSEKVHDYAACKNAVEIPCSQCPDEVCRWYPLKGEK